MVELLKKIETEILNIDNELNKEDSTTTFYHNFFKENNCSTIEGATSANKCDLLIALILRNNPNLSYEEVHDAIYAIEIVPEKLNHETVGELIQAIERLELFEYYEEVIDILSSKRSLSLTDIFKREGIVATAMIKLSEALDVRQEDFAKFIKLYIKEKDKVQEALAVVMSIKEVAEDREFHQQMLAFVGEDLGIKIKGKQKQKFISRQIQDDWKISTIMQPIREAMSYGNALEQNDKTKKRTLSKNKASYETLQKEIYKAIQGEEIRNVERLIGKIPSADIRLDTLKLIYKHNQEIYSKMTEEYNELAANDTSHYQVLLAKYGISPETYDVGTVMNSSISDLKQMLSQLTKLRITNPTDILSIIQVSNLETINNISGLIEKGILTPNLLYEHSSILNPNSKEYESLIRNFALLQAKKINPHYLAASEEVFLTPHQRLNQNIKTLEDYELVQLMKTGMDCSFLSQNNLEPAIDTLLELGYEKNLEECLELLNYKDNFERLRVLKVLNIPITTTEGLIEVLTTDKFIIPDNTIGDYIYNAAEHNLPSNITPLEEPKKKNPDIQKLSEFEDTSRTYNFDGVIVSKNKVARNLSMIATTGKTTDRLLYGVTKDSTFTDEEFAKIQSALVQKKSTSIVKQKQ